MYVMTKSQMQKNGPAPPATASDMQTIKDSAHSTAEVISHIEGLITGGHLMPGDRLPSIRDMASQFGVKAGLIRDALLDVQGRGLIKMLPRAGAFVEHTPLSPLQMTPAERLGERLRDLLANEDKNLFHLLDARETLEASLVSQAARKCQHDDLLPLRDLLEQMASIPGEQRDQTYVHLDIEFHLEIARLSGNAVMASMLRVVMEELAPHIL